MKYKVGDKVRVRKDLKVNEKYGGMKFNDVMSWHCGETVTIGDVSYGRYRIAGCGNYWTDEMFEPVEEELTAEEAIRMSEELCASSVFCSDCPIGRLKGNMRCQKFQVEHSDKVIEVLKQWKKYHKEKPIETECMWYVQIVETDTHILKHEEPLESVPGDETIAKILKKWCSEHEGKYYAISERRCVVKE